MDVSDHPNVVTVEAKAEFACYTDSCSSAQRRINGDRDWVEDAGAWVKIDQGGEKLEVVTPSDGTGPRGQGGLHKRRVRHHPRELQLRTQLPRAQARCRDPTDSAGESRLSSLGAR